MFILLFSQNCFFSVSFKSFFYQTLNGNFILVNALAGASRVYRHFTGAKIN